MLIGKLEQKWVAVHLLLVLFVISFTIALSLFKRWTEKIRKRKRGREYRNSKSKISISCSLNFIRMHYFYRSLNLRWITNRIFLFVRSLVGRQGKVTKPAILLVLSTKVIYNKFWLLFIKAEFNLAFFCCERFYCVIVSFLFCCAFFFLTESPFLVAFKQSFHRIVRLGIPFNKMLWTNAVQIEKVAITLIEYNAIMVAVMLFRNVELLSRPSDIDPSLTW